jgi:hypothetical protein
LTISISQPSPGAASVASSQKSTRRRKKQQPVHTLEEVFNQVSSATESSLNAPPGRVVLTPRSAEACLKLGVNPEILKIRDIDSFWEPGIDAAVQRLRHEAYVQRRHDTMKACRLERKRIINAAFDAHGGFEPGNEGLTPEQLLKQQQEQSSTLIQMELARIEKMQKRQEKELEQMIQYEINRAKLQEDMTQRIEEARRREEFKRRVVAEARRKLLQEHAAALRVSNPGCYPTGGILLLQGYNTDQLKYGTGGPKQIEYLYTESLLRESFPALEFLHLASHEKEVSEGKGHQGMSALLDLVARRPAAATTTAATAKQP